MARQILPVYSSIMQDVWSYGKGWLQGVAPLAQRRPSLADSVGCELLGMPGAKRTDGGGIAIPFRAAMAAAPRGTNEVGTSVAAAQRASI